MYKFDRFLLIFHLKSGIEVKVQAKFKRTSTDEEVVKEDVLYNLTNTIDRGATWITVEGYALRTSEISGIQAREIVAEEGYE